jgi:hypothetical protein
MFLEGSTGLNDLDGLVLNNYLLESSRTFWTEIGNRKEEIGVFPRPKLLRKKNFGHRDFYIPIFSGRRTRRQS